MAATVTVLSKVQSNLRSDGDADREISHATTSVNGVKYAIVRGVNEKGQRYLDQYDLEKKTHEKRPLQGGTDSLVAMSDEGLMAITSGGKMQVFNMATRQVVSSAQLPALPDGEANSVKYWKFTSSHGMVLYALDAHVYTWLLSTPNVAPVNVFKMQDSLLSGTVVDVQVSEDEQWFAVVVRAAQSDAKQSVQMFSVARGVSSVLEASAAAVYAHQARGCSMMALASKGPQGFRLIVAELASQPGPPKFERLVLELPSDSAHLLPVCILRQGNDPNILTVISQKGHVHVANTESRTWVAHAVLGKGDEDFFVGAFSPGFAHLVAISAQGSLYAISARGVGVTPNVPVAAAVAVLAAQTPSSSVEPPTAAPSTAIPFREEPVAPPQDSFSALSLQSMVEPRKPQNPLEEFFSVYPPEALSLYKNDRAKFLPYFREKGASLNWQGLLSADKDMSVASKLAFGQAVAHLGLASRGEVVSHFESIGYLDDKFTKANYMMEILAGSDSPADTDLQTNAIVLGLSVAPSNVVANVVAKRWTNFNAKRVEEAALENSQWDLVWLLATSFEQRQQLLSTHAFNINPNQILQWYNSLPADGCLTVLETLANARSTSVLSWERIAAPPNDRLAPHLDLTVSPPFQTLRVKVASAADPALWSRYIAIALQYGESKEVSRILLQHYADQVINEITESAVKKAAAESNLSAALPLLILAERSNKLEDLVAYHIARPKAQSSAFLIPYATCIQPQVAGRVVALVALNNASEVLQDLLLACARTEVLSTASLALAVNQSNTNSVVSSVLASLAPQHPDVPLLQEYHARFQTSSETSPSS
jgi:hypothetical protein